MATALPCDASLSDWQPCAARLKKNTSSAKRRLRYRRSSILCAQKQSATIKSMFWSMTVSQRSHTLRAEADEFVPEVELVLAALQEEQYAEDEEGAQCVVPGRRKLQDTCQAEQLPNIEFPNGAKIAIAEDCSDIACTTPIVRGNFVSFCGNVYASTCMGRGKGLTSLQVGKGIGNFNFIVNARAEHGNGRSGIGCSSAVGEPLYTEAGCEQSCAEAVNERSFTEAVCEQSYIEAVNEQSFTEAVCGQSYIAAASEQSDTEAVCEQSYANVVGEQWFDGVQDLVRQDSECAGESFSELDARIAKLMGKVDKLLDEG